MAFSVEEYKPCLAMVACQCIFAMMNLLTKAAFSQGFSNFVFAVYRQSIASLAILPPLFFSRGLEKMELRSLRTIICFSGTMILTFDKGPIVINLSNAYLNFGTALHSVSYRWVLAVVCLLGSSTCWSQWLILQSVFGTAVSFYLQTWCVSIRGPVYCAMFTPLNTIITVILAAITLHEELRIGRVIGAVAIFGGMYMVLWAKTEDVKGEGNDPTQTVGVSEVTISIAIEENHGEHCTRRPLLANMKKLET